MPVLPELHLRERRIVTVLFADLVGFTSLSERLDAEDVSTVQGEYFSAARDAVEARGGHVEKFIGDAVVGSFGTQHARDDDAARAVAAALAIVEAVSRIGSALALGPDALQVRLGVNTGEVVVARGDQDPDSWRITGDTVNVAARIQAAAAPGTVLVGPDTALAVADAFVIEPAGDLHLKGKALPVPAWRVVRARTEPSRASALHGLHAVTVGRERELDGLERLYAASHDRTTASLVIGPPGAGKSRLVSDLRARIEATGGTVWPVTVTGSSATYDVVAQLLRAALTPNAVRPGPDDALARLGERGRRAELGAEHARALLAGGTLDVPPSELFVSWTAVLDGVGDGPPPLWLIEDVHLAGPDERAFLAHAIAQPHRSGRMVLMTARPVMGGAEGAPIPGVPVIHLDPLGTESAAALVRALVGPGAIPEDVIEAVAAASGGNPLFIEEVLRSWVHSGALQPTGSGGWTFTRPAHRLDVPTTIRAVYTAQLDDLPESPKRVVEAGSVPGSTFPSRALPVLGVEEPDPALGELTGSGFLTGPHADVVDAEAYTYRHALLRDAAYGLLPRASRAQLHVRFANWAARTLPEHARAEIVGDHLATAYELAPALGGAIEGLSRDDLRDQAGQWLERAGESSLAAAPQRAAHLFARAVAFTPPTVPSVEARRRLRLAEALRRSGRLEEALAAFGQAGELAADAVAPAALGYEDALFESRLPRDQWGAAGLRLLSAALADETLDAATRSRLLAATARAQAYGGHRDEGEQSGRSALDLARRSGDDRALGSALLSLRASQSGPERLRDRLARADELVAAAARSGDRETELEALRLHFVDLLEAGDHDAAFAVRQRAEGLIAELRRPLYLWYPPMWNAMAALLHGDLDEAATLVEAFHDEGTRWHYRDVELVHAVQALQLHVERGSPEAALPALRRLAAREPERFAPSLAAGLAQAGLADEARQQLAVNGRHGFATLPQDLSLSYLLAQSIDAAVLVGDRDACAVLSGRLRPWDGHAIVLGSGAVCLGAASHYLGLAARTEGDLPSAVAHFEDALRMNERMEARAATARSRQELSRTLAMGVRR